MKKLKASIAYIFAAVIIFVLLFYAAVYADRFHDPDENSEICIINHLDETCWKQDGCFMRYDKDGYSSMVGVDVSKWNGAIDWEALKDQGIEFAIIRVGFRGYETGEIVEDPFFEEYIEGADAAGIKTGVYFYSQAIDYDEAVEEAEFVIEKLEGVNVLLPVFFDTEAVVGNDSRTNIMALANYTINAEAFCERIEAAGYRAGVYASKNWFSNQLDLPSISKYEIWYAGYGATPGTEIGFDIWQYSQEGHLQGCDTNLDMNVYVLKNS